MKRVVCESYPSYVNHIREVGYGEQLKETGGLVAIAICGRKITQGWDKPNAPLPRRPEEWQSRNGVSYCVNCRSRLVSEAESKGG